MAAAWDAEPAPATGGALSLLFAQKWLFVEETGRVILSDLTFAIGSIGVVFAVLWAYTSSPLLAGLGLLQILLAFPVTLFCYSVVLRIKLFSVLQAMAIFVILGIGADDVLILTGALLQARVRVRVRVSALTLTLTRALTLTLTLTRRRTPLRAPPPSASRPPSPRRSLRCSRPPSRRRRRSA